MPMTTQNFGRQLEKPTVRAGVPDGDGAMKSIAGGEGPNGGAITGSAEGYDESTNTGGQTQSPASLPIAGPETAPALTSGNTGGKTQSPVTGWVNSKKVVATFDGATMPTKVK